MKRFKGTQKFKNYKEMCEFLGMEPALRGSEREKQLYELRNHYDIEKHKSGRYSITYLSQKEQKRREGIASGKIKVIDGYEVNLKSPNCYEHTGIDKVILHCALNCKAETFAEFYAQCFGQCGYFQHILSDSLDEQYSFKALLKLYRIYEDEMDGGSLLTLSATDELMRSRLKEKIENCLDNLERKKFIKVNERYLLSNKTYVLAETVQPYVDQAYKNLGFRNPGLDMKSRSKREAFKKERNNLYQVDHPNVKIWRKELQITPLISPSHAAYPNMTEDERDHSLTLFFNVLQEKLLYDIAMATTRIGFPVQRPGYGEALVYDSMAKYIVKTYCVFEPGANDYTSLRNYSFYKVSNFEDMCKTRNHEPKCEEIPENIRDL